MDNYALSYHPHPPSRGARHPPPPESTHANFVCAGPGVVRWAFIRPMRRVIMFLSTLVRWALVRSRLRNKVPLCGWVARYRAPRKCNFRGWLCRGGLSPAALAKGGLSRVTLLSSRCLTPGSRSSNLFASANTELKICVACATSLFTWIPGSSPGMTS